MKKTVRSTESEEVPLPKRTRRELQISEKETVASEEAPAETQISTTVEAAAKIQSTVSKKKKKLKKKTVKEVSAPAEVLEDVPEDDRLPPVPEEGDHEEPDTQALQVTRSRSRSTDKAEQEGSITGGVEQVTVPKEVAVPEQVPVMVQPEEVPAAQPEGVHMEIEVPATSPKGAIIEEAVDTTHDVELAHSLQLEEIIQSEEPTVDELPPIEVMFKFEIQRYCIWNRWKLSPAKEQQSTIEKMIQEEEWLFTWLNDSDIRRILDTQHFRSILEEKRGAMRRDKGPAEDQPSRPDDDDSDDDDGGPDSDLRKAIEVSKAEQVAKHLEGPGESSSKGQEEVPAEVPVDVPTQSTGPEATKEDHAPGVQRDTVASPTAAPVVKDFGTLNVPEIEQVQSAPDAPHAEEGTVASPSAAQKPEGAVQGEPQTPSIHISTPSDFGSEDEAFIEGLPEFSEEERSAQAKTGRKLVLDSSESEPEEGRPEEATQSIIPSPDRSEQQKERPAEKKGSAAEKPEKQLLLGYKPSSTDEMMAEIQKTMQQLYLFNDTVVRLGLVSLVSSQTDLSLKLNDVRQGVVNAERSIGATQTQITDNFKTFSAQGEYLFQQLEQSIRSQFSEFSMSVIESLSQNQLVMRILANQVQFFARDFREFVDAKKGEESKKKLDDNLAELAKALGGIKTGAQLEKETRERLSRWEPAQVPETLKFKEKPASSKESEEQKKGPEEEKQKKAKESWSRGGVGTGSVKYPTTKMYTQHKQQHDRITEEVSQKMKEHPGAHPAEFLPSISFLQQQLQIPISELQPSEGLWNPRGTTSPVQVPSTEPASSGSLPIEREQPEEARPAEGIQSSGPLPAEREKPGETEHGCKEPEQGRCSGQPSDQKKLEEKFNIFSGDFPIIKEEPLDFDFDYEEEEPPVPKPPSPPRLDPKISAMYEEFVVYFDLGMFGNNKKEAWKAFLKGGVEEAMKVKDSTQVSAEEYHATLERTRREAALRRPSRGRGPSQKKRLPVSSVARREVSTTAQLTGQSFLAGYQEDVERRYQEKEIQKRRKEAEEQKKGQDK